MMNAEGSRQIKWESWSIELISPILRDTGLHTALNIETYPEKCLLYITTKHLWWQYPRIWFFSSPLLLRLAFNNLKDATARTVFIPAWIFVIMLHSWFSSSLNRFVCVCLGMILRRKIWSNCCKLLLLVSVNHRLFCLLCFFLFLVSAVHFPVLQEWSLQNTQNTYLCLYLWTVSTECVLKQRFYQNTFGIMTSLSSV